MGKSIIKPAGRLMPKNPSEEASRKTVFLVGAGPGDPDLLTLKALRVLQSADVILHDDLVSGAVLALAKPAAQRIAVGKRGGRPSIPQSKINAQIIALAQEGKRVVRLKGGDPMIFGRAGEEITACEAAGLAVDVVPGVTAALGAAASLRKSLTHRDFARRVQFVTAYAKDGGVPDDLDWSALADPVATTAIYMGKGVIADVAARILAAGLPAATPAMIVENATCSDERVFPATLGTMAARIGATKIEGPCIILLGRALKD